VSFTSGSKKRRRRRRERRDRGKKGGGKKKRGMVPLSATQSSLNRSLVLSRWRKREKGRIKRK